MRALVLPLILVACKAEGPPQQRDPQAAQALLAARPSPAQASEAILLERSGSGRARYLGFDVKGAIRAGATVELTHYFEVLAPFRGDYMVFVHGDEPGGARLFTADHLPVAGKVSTSMWQKGELWSDRHVVALPHALPSARIDLWVGLFAGEQRLTVEAKPGGSDGQDRIRAGSLAVEDAPKPAGDLPEVVVPRIHGKITADGKLDEPEWARAPVMGFSDSMGREAPARFPTKLRLLWDTENLYVGFEAVDQDVSCPFEKRDDPIYDHEAVEVFLMPNRVAPDLGPYLELQASPKGVIFDAAFVARRRGMDTGFDAQQKVGTTVDGTLNVDDGADKGFVSEWVVPWKGLRGVSQPPVPGEEWRMNAFRIEKWREGGKWAGEYTAWSPPRVGDFHNVERFGRLKFGE